VKDLRRRWSSAVYWLREISGDNAYEHYVADWHACHTGPERPPGEHKLMTPREFFDWRLERKYGQGFQRCC
jgi:uncharacterized short protein YbdD (DUF466 family)